ncbi:MAG: hypothetical protein AMS24_02580 [Chlamydiae bacterium SM23_39]|nr:MAG: hypothetical protein AMS24_02580 [Chlamydiae bacterium SM23_39]
MSIKALKNYLEPNKFLKLSTKILKPNSEKFVQEIIVSSIACSILATVSTFFTKGYISIKIISSALLKGGICYYLIDRITTLFNSQANKLVQCLSQKTIFYKEQDAYDKLFVKESLKYNNLKYITKLNTWSIFESSWASLFKNHFFSFSLIISVINTLIMQYNSINKSIQSLSKEELDEKFLSSLYPQLEQTIIDNFKKILEEENISTEEDTDFQSQKKPNLELLDKINNDFRGHLLAWFLITKNSDKQWFEVIAPKVNKSITEWKKKYTSLSPINKFNLNLKILDELEKEQKQSIKLSSKTFNIYDQILEISKSINQSSWFKDKYLPSVNPSSV